jgi:hypothetical protein
MTRRRGDAFARAVFHDAPDEARTQRWRRFRRTGLPIVVAVAIIVACAVIVDLPSPATLANDRAAATSLVTEVNNDITPCAFAINETARLYHDEGQHSLSTAERSKVPTLLDDDASACSFTSGSINDLTDIEEPGTGTGRFLAQVISLSVTWTTSDALGAIDDIDALATDPHDAQAARDLRVRSRYLAADRRAALAALAGADRELQGGLPTLDMPNIRFTT